jgi:hypothetical protein
MPQNKPWGTSQVPPNVGQKLAPRALLPAFLIEHLQSVLAHLVDARVAVEKIIWDVLLDPVISRSDRGVEVEHLGADRSEMLGLVFGSCNALSEVSAGVIDPNDDPWKW